MKSSKQSLLASAPSLILNTATLPLYYYNVAIPTKP